MATYASMLYSGLRPSRRPTYAQKVKRSRDSEDLLLNDIPCSACADGKTELDALKAVLQQKEGELEEQKAHERASRDAAKTLQRQLDDANALAERRKDKYVELASSSKRAQEHINQLDVRARRAEARVAELERTLANAQQERRNIGTLLETRTAELRDAQAYLTMVDDVTDRDVLDLVHTLNSRIYQTSATIADTFQGRYSCQPGSEQAADQACMQLEQAQALGPELLHALRTADHSADSVLVQTALQGLMYTRWLCATWDFHLTEPGFLQGLYKHIKAHEPQSVSGRWRALTRLHVKELAPDAHKRQTLAADTLAEHIAHILVVCGVPVPHQPLLAAVMGDFADALHEVVRLSLEFQHVTGERIVSRDLCAVYARSGELFDATCMTDEWADPKARVRVAEKVTVLCTTQLGLLREESRAPGVKEGPLESTVLLKPQVVLKSMLDELWREQVETGKAGAMC
ncbi:hypothetical protein C8Q76DRAFT_820428 [Earliella scabrosa]|nr:hypothetical protein C8Q76DRAFT_820428 [Earliella scabrosa]